MITNKTGSSFVDVEVSLLDANDNNPTFIPNNVYEFNITTDSKSGDHVGQIHAIDPDLGRNGMVLYSIQAENNISSFIKIDNRTGRMTLFKAPKSTGRHLLFVEAADQPLNPSERRTSLAVITVNVKNPGKLI